MTCADSSTDIKNFPNKKKMDRNKLKWTELTETNGKRYTNGQLANAVKINQEETMYILKCHSINNNHTNLKEEEKILSCSLKNTSLIYNPGGSRLHKIAHLNSHMENFGCQVFSKYET